MVSRYLATFLLLFYEVNVLAVPLFAFTKAEGYGAVAEGGRSGKVTKVTNFNCICPGKPASG